MRLLNKLCVLGVVLLACGSARAQEPAGQTVGVHGNVAFSYVVFFALAGIAVYLVFKGNQNR